MSTPTGAVYDRGYRPYEGPRGGRGSSRAALWRTSVRRALGIRRDWRQKVFPWALVALATLPAVFAVMAAYGSSRTPLSEVELVSHRDYVSVSSILLLFVAAVAPDLVCPDRRNRTLPLIFARPLTGDDYVVAKVGAIAALVFGFSFVPQVVLFVGQMLVNRDGALDYVGENADALWQVPVALVVLASFYAVLGVAVAATTGRRVVASVAILAVLLVSSIVSAVGRGDGGDSGSSGFEDRPPEIEEGEFQGGEFEGGEFEGGEFEGGEFEGGEFEFDPPKGSMWAVVDLGEVPIHLTDVIFLGHADPDGPLSQVEGGSAAALGVYVAVVVGGVVYLRRRYRTVSL